MDCTCHPVIGIVVNFIRFQAGAIYNLHFTVAAVYAVFYSITHKMYCELMYYKYSCKLDSPNFNHAYSLLQAGWSMICTVP